jgi:hypothetical protein
LFTIFSADTLYINIQLSGCTSCSWIIIGNFTEHHNFYSFLRGILSLFFIFPIKHPILYLFLQQQMDTSVSTPIIQAPQPIDVDAPQPVVVEAQQKRKALTDAEAQQKRQKPTPAPASAPTPVDQPSEQTAPAQDTSSAIVPQGPTTDVVIEDIPSASSADPSQDPLQAAPSSQAQEIALKQVNQSIT